MSLCWVFYGDVWGFAELARRKEDDALKRLRSSVIVVKKLRRAHPTVDYFILSDTILCIRQLDDNVADSTAATDKGFEDMLVAVQFLIAEFLNVELLLRGVVTF